MYNKPLVKNVKNLCKRVYVQKEKGCKEKIKDNRYDNFIVNKMLTFGSYIVLYI